MRTRQKIIWGVFAVAPWAWLIAVVIFNFVLPGFSLAPEKYPFLVTNWYLISVIALMIIWAAFVYHAMRNEFIPDEKRTLWIWVLVFGNIYVYPFYWWHYVCNAPENRN